MQKYHVMAMKQHLGKNVLHLQSIQEKIFTNYFSCNFNRLSIYDNQVDRVLADYNGYYRQKSGKSDKYGFIWCLPEKFPMRLDMFLNSSTKFEIF